MNIAKLVAALEEMAEKSENKTDKQEADKEIIEQCCLAKKVESAVMLLDRAMNQWENPLDDDDSGFVTIDLIDVATALLSDKELDSRQQHILVSMLAYGKRKDLLSAEEIDAVNDGLLASIAQGLA